MYYNCIVFYYYNNLRFSNFEFFVTCFLFCLVCCCLILIFVCFFDLEKMDSLASYVRAEQKRMRVRSAWPISFCKDVESEQRHVTDTYDLPIAEYVYVTKID